METKGIQIDYYEEPRIILGSNYLFLIGIDEYKNDIPLLSSCVKDLIALRDIFWKKYEFEEDKTYILLNKDATRKNILSYLKKLKNILKKDDNLIILYSGHGTVIDGIGFWIPVEASIGEEDEYISTSEITDRLAPISCLHLFLIVDACFAGSIFSESSYKILNRVDQTRTSRWGLSASHSREVALDGSLGDNSPFAKRLLEFLKLQEQPFSVQRLSDYVIETVQHDTDSLQNPISRPLKLRDDFGRFMLYPRGSFFRFEKVLTLVSQGNYFEATTELSKFLKETTRLPKGYEVQLVRISNRVHGVDNLFRKGAIDEDNYKALTNGLEIEVRAVLAELPRSKREEVHKYARLLDLLAKGKIYVAIEQARKIAKPREEVENAFILLSCEVHLLEQDFKNLHCSSEDYLNGLDYITSYFIFLLEHMDNETYFHAERLGYIYSKLSDERIEYLIFLLKDYTTYSEIGAQEIIYLLEILSSRLETLKEKIGLGSITDDDLQMEYNRMREGLKYLFKRVVEEVHKSQTLKPEASEENAFMEGIENAHRWSTVMKNILARARLEVFFEWVIKYKGGLSGKVEQLYNQFNIAKRSRAHGLEESQINRMNMLKMAKGILNLLKENDTGKLVSENNNELDHINNLYSEMHGKPQIAPIQNNNIQRLNQVKSLIALSNTEEAIQILLQCELSSEKRMEALFLKNEQDRNIEDDLFSQKDRRIIDLRNEKLSKQFLVLVDQLILEEKEVG